ncbi:adapter protein MecA 1/2 [Lachnospiraceae bacterium]|nr:adapter protein MecA 1/2 [Lachnospiraceae bacterium]
MKIEKVNDHQIRCTLTKADLAERELKISELAYGTDKAKSLFRDMIQQASYQFGFEAEDIPLMIEAIPLSSEAIVLIITKVEDPEELDTRFSKFAPSLRGDETGDTAEVHSGADDVLDLFRKIKDGSEGSSEKPASNTVNSGSTMPYSADNNAAVKSVKKTNDEVQITVPVEITKLYSFRDLEGVTRLGHILDGYYNGENTLYRDPVDRRYYLIAKKSSHTPEQFNKICNIITEYAGPEKFTPSVQAWYEEHGEVIIRNDALQSLAKI